MQWPRFNLSFFKFKIQLELAKTLSWDTKWISQVFWRTKNWGMYGISKVQRLVRGLKPTLFTIRSLSIVSPQKTDKTPLPLHVERSVRPRIWKRGLGPFWRNTNPSLVTDNDSYFFYAFLDRATKRTTKRTTKTTIIIHEIAGMESPPYPILVRSALWHTSYLPTG